MSAASNPWDSIYEREGRVFTEPFQKFDAVVEKFALHRCRRILDLGCGNGRHVVALTREGFNTVGFEFSLTGLRLAREWLGEEGLRAGLVGADARQCFPFEAGSFEGLLSTQVIHHARLSEVRVTIQEMWRVLANGGIAFVTVAGSKNEGIVWEEVETGTFVPLDGSEKGLPHHIFSEEELRSEFEVFQIDEISRRDEGKVLALWLTKVAQSA